MHRRILLPSLLGFICIIIFDWGCTKLDTTDLGTDLIPAVDNVNTFADTFYINATQNPFDDTAIVRYFDNQALGNISNDPLFGTTDANMFFQVKPNTYPFYFGNADSLAGLGLDSVVLCLSYKYFWGDSAIPQRLQVFEVTDPHFRDSVDKGWRVDEEPITGSAISAPKDVDVRTLANYMKYKGDSVNNQIRIPLDALYANRIWTSDSASMGSGNHAYNNDSLYRKEFNGIAVKAVGAGSGNGLMYINLADTNTKIEVHYRIRRAGIIDTTYRSFAFKTFTSTSTSNITTYISSSANSIKRNRTISPSNSPNTTEVYLQAHPGTSLSFKIPELDTFTNKIIHRAELIVEQIPMDPNYDTLFSSPNFIYLDLKEPGTAIPARYKPLYIDLNPNENYDPDNTISGLGYYPSQIDFTYFGGYLRRKVGPVGGMISYYNLNISRYVQRLIKTGTTNYEMRLWAPFSIHYPQYSPYYTSYSNNPAYGRIKVGNGQNALYPMRVRIIYSLLKK